MISTVIDTTDDGYTLLVREHRDSPAFDCIKIYHQSGGVADIYVKSGGALSFAAAIIKAVETAKEKSEVPA